MIQDTEDRQLGISRLHDEYYKRNRGIHTRGIHL